MVYFGVMCCEPPQAGGSRLVILSVPDSMGSKNPTQHSKLDFPFKCPDLRRPRNFFKLSVRAGSCKSNLTVVSLCLRVIQLLFEGLFYSPEKRDT